MANRILNNRAWRFWRAWFEIFKIHLPCEQKSLQSSSIIHVAEWLTEGWSAIVRLAVMMEWTSLYVLQFGPSYHGDFAIIKLVFGFLIFLFSALKLGFFCVSDLVSPQGLVTPVKPWSGSCERPTRGLLLCNVMSRFNKRFRLWLRVPGTMIVCPEHSGYDISMILPS